MPRTCLTCKCKFEVKDGEMQSSRRLCNAGVQAVLHWVAIAKCVNKMLIHASRRLSNAEIVGALHRVAIAESVSSCWYILAEDSAGLA